MFACEYDPAATVDDGSCATHFGNACDDGNDLTIDDTVQFDCSCQGLEVSNPLVPTQPDYPSGTYDRYDMIKADWVGADDYRFVFTPQSGGAPMVHEQGLPNTFSLLSEVDGLQAGETYDLTVDAGYDLGLSWLYWEPGVVVTEITVALPVTSVTATDACSVHGPHFLGDYISAEAFVCGADKWIWYFQAAGEIPIQHVKNGAGRYLRLSAVPGLTSGETYTMTLEAGYPDGSTTLADAGTCIQIIGLALGADCPEVDTEAVTERDLAVAEAALYPNPNNGQQVMVNLTGVQQAQVQVWVYSTAGAVVAHTTWQTAGGHVQQPLQLGGLAAGTYVVRFDIDGTPLQQTLVVTP